MTNYTMQAALEGSLGGYVVPESRVLSSLVAKAELNNWFGGIDI